MSPNSGSFIFYPSISSTDTNAPIAKLWVADTDASISIDWIA